MARLTWVEFGDNGFETKEAHADDGLTRIQIWALACEIATQNEHTAVSAYYIDTLSEREEFFAFADGKAPPEDRQPALTLGDQAHFDWMLRSQLALISGFNQQTMSVEPVICVVTEEEDGAPVGLTPVGTLLMGDPLKLLEPPSGADEVNEGDFSLVRRAHISPDWMTVGFREEKDARMALEEIERQADGALQLRVYQLEDGLWELAWFGHPTHMSALADALSKAAE